MDPRGLGGTGSPAPCQDPQRALCLLPQRGRQPLVPVCPACHLRLPCLCRLGVRVPVPAASLPVFGLFLGLLCPCLVSVRLSLSASASGLHRSGPARRTPCAPSPPARDRTSCPRRRAFPGLPVTRRGGNSGWQPSRLRAPPALPLAGHSIPRPLGSRPQGPARKPAPPSAGTRLRQTQTPAALRRDANAHAQSPPQPRPAGAWGGQPAARAWRGRGRMRACAERPALSRTAS